MIVETVTMQALGVIGLDGVTTTAPPKRMQAQRTEPLVYEVAVANPEVAKRRIVATALSQLFKIRCQLAILPRRFS